MREICKIMKKGMFVAMAGLALLIGTLVTFWAIALINFRQAYLRKKRTYRG